MHELVLQLTCLIVVCNNESMFDSLKTVDL